MVKFIDRDPLEFMTEVELGGAIPGQSFTDRPKALPTTRPPAIADPETLLARMIDSFQSSKNSRNVLKLIKSGIPVDVISASVLEHFVGEGGTSPQAAMTVAPALTVLIMRMAASADIDFQVSPTDELQINDTDLAVDNLEKILTKKEENKGREAARSSRDLVKLPSSDRGQGILQRPEGLV